MLWTVGWGSDQSVGGFGEEPGMKAQIINLIRSIRLVMRGEYKTKCKALTSTSAGEYYLI